MLRGKAAAALCEEAARDGGLALTNARLSRTGFVPDLGPRLRDGRDTMLASLGKAGMSGVARGTLAEEAGLSDQEMKTLVGLLIEDGTLSLAGNHLFLRESFDECRRRLIALFDGADVVEVGAFRKATGVSRNVSVSILEAFDAEGLTRRSGKGRVLVKR
jgi:selenocysteine-specific elongation factor